MRAVSFQATTGGGRRNPNKKQTKKQKGKTKKQRSWKSPAGESPTNRCVGTSAEHATGGGGGHTSRRHKQAPISRRNQNHTKTPPHLFEGVFFIWIWIFRHTSSNKSIRSVPRQKQAPYVSRKPKPHKKPNHTN